MIDSPQARVTIVPADPNDPAVRTLLAALDAELAAAGYAPDQQFGYDAERLAEAGVHLVGARREDALVGIGGIELSGSEAELKRCYVQPEHRGTGVAEALLQSLVNHAVACGARVLRLETGIRQHAALRFYRRHGFREIPRFGPYISSETSVCLARDLAAPAVM